MLADYIDGEKPLLIEVSLEISAQGLRVLFTKTGGEESWPLSQIRVVQGRKSKRTLAIAPNASSQKRIFIPANSGIAQRLLECESFPIDSWDRPVLLKTLRTTVLAAAAVFAMFYFFIPKMAEQLALILPPEIEEALGATIMEEVPDFLESVHCDTDKDECEFPVSECVISARERAVVNKALRSVESQANLPFPLKIHFWNADFANAFALPGGHVLFTSEIMEEFKSQEQFFAVLAHEAGHIENRDVTRGIFQSAGTVGILGLFLGDFAGGFLTVAIVERFLDASYSRDVETRADEYAYRIIGDLGYSTAPMADMFAAWEDDGGSGDSGLETHLSSHPDMGLRVKRALDADRYNGKSRSQVLSGGEWSLLKAACQ